MTSHPAPKARSVLQNSPLSPSAQSWLGRWLFQHPHPASQVGYSREEVERAVHTRTSELEREIAMLREEIDRRNAMQRHPAQSTAEPFPDARTSFLAAISHELRTPLNAIIGMTSLLGKTALTPEQAGLVETMREGCNGLLRSANDILDFAKIEAGRLAIASVDFDLAQEIHAAVNLCADAAARKGLRLIVDIEAALPARLRGDPMRLRQVVINLLDNAVKFTAQGEVICRVQLERSGQNHSRIRFGVTDTGIGIAPDAQMRIFAPFVQADAGTARRFGGTGLGLTICKHLVTLMGGEMGLSSAPGSGSTFWFSLGFDHVTHPSETASSPSTLAGRHVLIVDDNATNRKLFCQLTASWDMRADVVDSGAAALTYLREAARSHAPVDLVLIDHHLDGMNGLGLAKDILAEPQVPPPVLTVLISHGRQLTHAEMKSHGIAACAAKPLHPRRLRVMLQEALAARDANREPGVPQGVGPNARA